MRRGISWGLLAASLLLAGCSGGGGREDVGGRFGGSGRGGRDASLSDLTGKPPAAVRQAIGVPTLTRREPPAEVWQYTASSCVLDIVFYPHEKTMIADFFDSRDLEGRPMDSGECLRRLASGGGR